MIFLQSLLGRLGLERVVRCRGRLSKLIKVIDFLCLLLPGLSFGFHLKVLLVLWLAVRASNTVPEGEILAIVVVEVEMVDGMVSGRVDDVAVELVLAVMDQDGPHIDGGKHGEIDVSLHWAAEDKDVVRD